MESSSSQDNTEEYSASQDNTLEYSASQDNTLEYSASQDNTKEYSSSQDTQHFIRRPCIIVAATGCIAAAKLGPICQNLKVWADVQAVVTEGGRRFLDIGSIPNNLTIYYDNSELTYWSKLGDPVLHITLEKWADMLVIAPLSSNTLAKIAAGLCDNLLTSIVKAWDCKKPLLIAPAMNSLMWENILTEQHLTFMDEKMDACLIRHEDSEDSDAAPMATVSEICSTIYSVWQHRIS